ncbi:HAD family hydrolase [Desulfonatronovibrio magnus]|uniref:HAD family hydrolase n=1 Tax=Desulfonatronovibrio magnus TaxID=698827 RepID=UPI0005EBD2D7|nr:HAD family hydrolase [Desulfonatronovibrio magnus]
MQIVIPGYKTLELEHLALDYNGTLAFDGEIIEGVVPRLKTLSESLSIHVLTADTFGHARQKLSGVDCSFHLIGKGDQAQAKADYIDRLGAEHTISMGNGRNDRLMLERSALGIGLVQGEGAAVNSLTSADIICTHINHGLDLLLFPLRLTATLRG